MGGRLCSRVGCARNGRRQRDLAGLPEEFRTQGPEPEPTAQDPHMSASPVPPVPPAEPALELLLAELRGLLHEVLETA